MGKNWAICIGINEYYNLQPLEYAKRDAESMRNFFLTEARFEQVYYFSDDSPQIPADRGPMRSIPTFANLKRFLRERFGQPFLSVGDNFWFFFAGHGELHEGHDYLMPIDVDPGAIEETAIRISDLTTIAVATWVKTGCRGGTPGWGRSPHTPSVLYKVAVAIHSATAGQTMWCCC